MSKSLVGRAGPVRRVAAVLLFLLGYQVSIEGSMVARWIAERGFPAALFGGAMMGVAMLLLVFVQEDVVFVIATAPYAVYVSIAVWLVISRGSGYATGIIYSLTLVLLVDLYLADRRRYDSGR